MGRRMPIQPKLLLLTADPELRQLVTGALRGERVELSMADSLHALSSSPPDLLVLDASLVSTLPQLASCGAFASTLVVIGDCAAPLHAFLLESGVVDFIPKRDCKAKLPFVLQQQLTLTRLRLLRQRRSTQTIAPLRLTEVRDLITSILGNAELVLTAGQLPSRSRYRIEQIRLAAEQLALALRGSSASGTPA